MSQCAKCGLPIPGTAYHLQMHVESKRCQTQQEINRWKRQAYLFQKKYMAGSDLNNRPATMRTDEANPMTRKGADHRMTTPEPRDTQNFPSRGHNGNIEGTGQENPSRSPSYRETGNSPARAGGPLPMLPKKPMYAQVVTALASGLKRVGALPRQAWYLLDNATRPRDRREHLQSFGSKGSSNNPGMRNRLGVNRILAVHGYLDSVSKPSTLENGSKARITIT